MSLESVFKLSLIMNMIDNLSGPMAGVASKVGANVSKLDAAIAAWAEDDFRSVNGQIEYLLTECVRQRKKNGKYVSDEIDVPPELDIE